MKKLLSLLEKKYRWYSILTPILIVGEVIMEVIIPMIMAQIVDVGIANNDIRYVLIAGGLMVLMAMLSLGFGAGAGRSGLFLFQCGPFQHFIPDHPHHHRCNQRTKRIYDGHPYAGAVAYYVNLGILYGFPPQPRTVDDFLICHSDFSHCFGPYYHQSLSTIPAYAEKI